MVKIKQKRKVRQDRNHVGYMITNEITGERYIGITVVKNGAKKSLKIRWQKHVRRALTEGRQWTLCKSIRRHGAENFVMEEIFKIRGRKPAHAAEREHIAEYKPELNQY